MGRQKVANEDSASDLLLQPGIPVNVWADGAEPKR